MFAKSLGLFLFFITVSEAGNSQYKWIDKVGSCKLHNIPAPWQEARLRCIQDGGVMASTMKPVLLTPLMKEFGRQQVFLGIHTDFTGEFYSIDGTPLDSISVEWAPNEPDNLDDSESCLALHSNGTVADVKCSRRLPYICCKDTKKADVQKAQRDGYICEQSLGSCYKFHINQSTWSRAFKTCSAESGHLAIVNSYQEAKYLKALAIRSSVNPSEEASFIGFRAWGEPSIWLTIEGQPIEETGYFSWGSGQPDNSTSFGKDGENCGTLRYRHDCDDCYIHDYPCEMALTFICEKRMDLKQGRS